MNIRNIMNIPYVLILLALFLPQLSADNFTWRGGENNNWQNSGNWRISSGIPDASNDFVTFDADVNRPDLDLSGITRTVGSMTFNNDLGKNFTFTNGGITNYGNLTLGTSSRSITFGSNLTYTNVGYSTWGGTGGIFNGNLAGAAGSIINLSSPFTFNAANSYTGLINIDTGGKITIGDSDAFANAVIAINTPDGFDLNGLHARIGGLKGSGSLALGNSTLNISSTSNLVYSGDISGDPNSKIVLSGTGALTYSGFAAGFSAVNLENAFSFTIDGGVISGTEETSTHSSIDSDSRFTVKNGGVLEFHGPYNHISGQLTVESGGTYNTNILRTYDENWRLNIDSGGTLEASELLLDNSYELSEGVLTVSGEGSLVETEELQLGVSGNASISTTEVEIVDGGSIAVSGETYIGRTSILLAVNGGTFSTGSLVWQNYANVTFAMSDGVSTGSALTIGTDDTDSNLIGSIADADGGPGSILKVGTGSLTFNEASTYSGGTTITAGTVFANNTSGSALGTGSVAVNAGATLGGPGNIDAAVQVDAGGFIAPGNSIGSLAMDALTLAGSYLCEIDGTNSDRLEVSGALDINTSTLDVSALGNSLTEQVSIIATYGTLSGTFASVSHPEITIDYAYDDGNTSNNIALIVTLAPEVSQITGSRTGDSVLFDVTFSESVTGFGPDDITLTTSDSLEATVTNVTGSGANYQVTTSLSPDSGSLTLSILAGTGVQSSLTNLPLQPSTANTSSPISIPPAPYLHSAFAQLNGVTLLFNENITLLENLDDLIVITTGTLSITEVEIELFEGSFDILLIKLTGKGSVKFGIKPNSGAASLNTGRSVKEFIMSEGMYFDEIDFTPPVVTNISAPAGGSTMVFDVTFNEDIRDFGIEDILLQTTGTLSASVLAVENGTYNVLDPDELPAEGQGTEFQVTVGNISGNGTLELSILTGPEGVWDTSRDALVESAANTSGSIPILNDPTPVHYVSPTGSNEFPYSSWATAAQDLHAAILVSESGDQIWIAEGSYRPDQGGGHTLGDQTASFTPVNGTSIYGGFSISGEPTLSERDPEAFPTIISGDLGTNDGANLLDDNSNTLFSLNENDTGLLFSGLTLSGAKNTSQDRGSAISTNPGNELLLQQCKVTNNHGVSGSIWANSSQITFERCQFFDNENSSDSGGAIRAYQSSLTFLNCEFQGNSALSLGGALHAFSNCILNFTNCLFAGNSATPLNNQSHGGAVAIGHAPALSSTASFTNCSFQGNSALSGAALVIDSISPLTNCIFWGNSGASISGSGSPTFDHCLVEGIDLTTQGNGNLDGTLASNNPDFVSPADFNLTPIPRANLRLQSTSPCLNIGLNSANTSSLDLDQMPRIVNETIDFGAYEYSPRGLLSATPSTQGPTNANSLDFDLTFSEPVLGFDQADDIVINQVTGNVTASGATIVDSGDATTFTFTLTGISGDGIFTISANTNGNLTDFDGVPIDAATQSPEVTIDNTPPVLTLNGATSVNLDLGSLWSDPGAQATDNIDSSVTIINGGDTIDTSSTGVFILTYDATDLAGNTAPQLTRTVTIQTAYTNWALTQGLTLGVNDHEASDPDGDGLTNLAEFAFNENPLANNRSRKTRLSLANIDGETYLTLTLPVCSVVSFESATSQLGESSEIIYQIEGTIDLNTYDQIVEEITPALDLGLPSLESGWNYHSFRLQEKISSNPNGFLRVRLSLPSP